MLHRLPPSSCVRGLGFAFALALAIPASGCARAPAKGPVRATLARGETIQGPCGLRLTFDGGGHTIGPGGHEMLVGFTTAVGDQTRGVQLFAKDAGKVQDAFGHRWLVVSAEGFDPKSAVVEVCSEPKP